MITIRKGKRRHLHRRHRRDVWKTFCPDEVGDPFSRGFATLQSFSESRIPPGRRILQHPHHGTEMITYIREGALEYASSLGRAGTIQAGEFQRMTAGRGIHHSEANASQSGWTHIFRISLRPPHLELEPDHEEKRFTVAERRGRLCLIASPDARNGSLRLHQDALLYSGVLAAGQHIVHELAEARSAWLHVVEGEVTLGDILLDTGDGAGFVAECAISVTARQQSEVLLLDLSRFELPAHSDRDRSSRLAAFGFFAA